MKQVVFIFPGQGAQKAGMGRDLYDAFPEARRVFDAHPDIRDLCLNGTEADLKQTSVTQPAIYLVSMAIRAVLEAKGVRPVAAAGHSLGEYSALASAGVFSVDEGMLLVRERGWLMQDEGSKIPGGMAAIIGLDDAQVKEICAGLTGIVEPVNFNAPGQVVISGEKAAIERSLDVFTEKGARMAIPLAVSGAFHSSLLAGVGKDFGVFLAGKRYAAPSFKVAANVDAEYYAAPSEVPAKLSRQIHNPVLWTAIVKKFVDDGFRDFVEVGPGNVLKGLMKKIDPALKVDTTASAAELNAVLAKVLGGEAG